jgi:branched-chain amino acid transport system ATP-binding protein
MSLLDVRDVQKRFGGVQAVRGVSLQVAPGELVGLFGPNGAGKTTLFNLIAGSFAADSGSIRFGGADIGRLAAWRRARLGLARTFQVVRPFRDLTVIENVLAAVPRTGAAAASPLARAQHLLAQVGLDGRGADLAGTLTLGMLKRLEVARALALDPLLLLLDEPLAGLTGREAAGLLALVAGLRAHSGIVMVEHNVRQCLPICDRAVVMDAGAVIAVGTPAQIRADPRVIRAYLGEQAA